EVAGAILSARHPAGVGQGAQVAAHRRLRQLQRPVQLTNGELMPLERGNEPRANGVREGGQAAEEGRSFHPYIRIKGYLPAAVSQGAARRGRGGCARATGRPRGALET